MSSLFSDVPKGPVDPMFLLKVQVDGDRSPQKIDVGAGVYRDEAGAYYELSVIRKAKKLLEAANLGHDYELTTGNVEFLEEARKLIFGQHTSERISSVQTVSGTGANHLGAAFLKKFLPKSSGLVYVGTPTWGNYDPLFVHAGFKVVQYQHYNSSARKLDFESILSAVKEAPVNSIFVLQGCCHNPTAVNMSNEQWKKLAVEMRTAKQFPFIDIAYQGLGKGLDEDAYGVRHFTEVGLEVVVCQSFSKNMGLYGERVGVLHVVSTAESVARNVTDQLRGLIRWEFSSSPAYGSRLATIVMRSPDLKQELGNELRQMRKRLDENRVMLHHHLTVIRKTPGTWDFILTEEGLFSFLPLSKIQVLELVEQHHIYLPSTGRINIAGLSSTTVGRFADALDIVVRAGQLK